MFDIILGSMMHHDKVVFYVFDSFGVGDSSMEFNVLVILNAL